MTPTIVAAVQFQPELLNVEKNLSVALQLTFEAASKGARLIVLPETCIGGNVLRDEREALKVCQEKDGYQTQAFMSLAAAMNCRIVLGYVQLFENCLYNSAVVIGPYGVEGNVQKKNLFGSDYLWCEPGDMTLNPVMVTENVGRLGVLVCRDAMNHYRKSYAFNKDNQPFYRKGSVDTIALLTSWGGEYAYPDVSWMELGESLSANVVVSNRVGRERDMSYKGGSCIITRNQKVYTNGSNFDGPAVVGGIIEL